MNVTPAPAGDIYVNDRILSSTLTTYDPKVIQLYFWYGNPHKPAACGAACTGFFNESKDGACTHLCWSGNFAYYIFGDQNPDSCLIDCNKVTYQHDATWKRIIITTNTLPTSPTLTFRERK